jgi:hypothetical protein
MARVGLLDRVHGQRADGVDRKLIQRSGRFRHKNSAPDLYAACRMLRAASGRALQAH